MPAALRRSPSPPLLLLLRCCSDKGVDYAAHTNTEDGGAVFLNLLGNLAFPLLLVGGLFLLSRRQGGGMGGGPGGPGNPMAFGKSKAKFQMEPNTGVTFGDVAGVDEAKQDFQVRGGVGRGGRVGRVGVRWRIGLGRGPRSWLHCRCAAYSTPQSCPAAAVPPPYRTARRRRLSSS